MPRSSTRKYKKNKGSKTMCGGRITSSEKKKLLGAREFWKKNAQSVNPTERKEKSSLVELRKLKAAQQRRSNYTISRKKSLSDLLSNKEGTYLSLKTSEKSSIPPSLPIVEEEGAEAAQAEAAAAARAAKLKGIRKKRVEKDNSEERKLKEIFDLYDALGTEEARKISPKIEAVINKSNGSSTSSIRRNQIKALEERQRELGKREVEAAFSPKEKTRLLPRLFRKKSSKKGKTSPTLYGGTRKR